jgi:hypothetical protein|tara:strand:+ start:1151 stop:1717 length:567 start_codon:yes stop_codon:yes gene_type:complete
MAKKDVQYRSIKPGNVLVTRNREFPDQIDSRTQYILFTGIPVDGFLEINRNLDTYEFEEIIHPKGHLTFRATRWNKDEELWGKFDFINPYLWDIKDLTVGAIGGVYDERILKNENPELVKEILEGAKNVLLEDDTFIKSMGFHYGYSSVTDDDYFHSKDVSPAKNILNHERGRNQVLGQIEKLLSGEK